MERPVEVFFNVGYNAFVDGEMFPDYSEEQIYEWIEEHPFTPFNIANAVLKEESKTLADRNITAEVNDEEDYKQDDRLFQNYYGMAISYNASKETEDYIFQLRNKIVEKIEKRIKNYFDNKDK